MKRNRDEVRSKAARPSGRGGRTGLSRREILRGAGCAATAAMAAAWSPLRAAAAAWPAQAESAAAALKISPAMLRLSEYMSEAGARALPDAVTEAVKQHLLDTVASMISVDRRWRRDGRRLKFLRAARVRRLSQKTATVAGLDVQCGAIEAAMANAVLAQADETDDTHAASLRIRAARWCPRLWRRVSSSA